MQVTLLNVLPKSDLLCLYQVFSSLYGEQLSDYQAAKNTLKKRENSKEMNTFLNEFPIRTNLSALKFYLYCTTHSRVNRQVISSNNGPCYKFLFCNFAALCEDRRRCMTCINTKDSLHTCIGLRIQFLTWLQLFLCCILPPSEIKHRRGMVRILADVTGKIMTLKNNTETPCVCAPSEQVIINTILLARSKQFSTCRTEMGIHLDSAGIQIQQPDECPPEEALPGQGGTLLYNEPLSCQSSITLTPSSYNSKFLCCKIEEFLSLLDSNSKKSIGKL